MNKCTWYNCKNEGTHLEYDDEGCPTKINLCDKHDQMMLAAWLGNNPHHLGKLLLVAEGKYIPTICDAFMP